MKRELVQQESEFELKERDFDESKQRNSRRDFFN
jgi:hypothetical protein